jgi:hypothetical protein
VEQTNLYYQQHLDGQGTPSCWLPDIKLPDMIFTALALQMEHEMKDTLHNYWPRLRQLHALFYSKTMTQDRFLHILLFCILQTIHRELTKAQKMTDHGN